MLYMLGVVLPILGLVILPMVAGFLTTDISPLRLAAYLALLYNAVLPTTIYFMARITLSKRPTGYGQDDISEHFPVLKQMTSLPLSLFGNTLFLSPKKIAWTAGLLLFFIGVIPLLIAFSSTPAQLLAEQPFAGTFKLLGYRESLVSTALIGPYGIGATLFGLAVTMSAGIGFGIYYLLHTRKHYQDKRTNKKT